MVEAVQIAKLIQSVVISLATISTGVWAFNTFAYKEKIVELKQLARSLVNFRHAVRRARNQHFIDCLSKYTKNISTEYLPPEKAPLSTETKNIISIAQAELESDCEVLLHVPRVLRFWSRATVMRFIPEGTDSSPIKNDSEMQAFEKDIQTVLFKIEDEAEKHVAIFYKMRKIINKLKVRDYVSLILIGGSILYLVSIMFHSFFTLNYELSYWQIGLDFYKKTNH